MFTKNIDHLYQAAVIGGGPSGIQAAGELMKRGFQVTIFERHGQLGGTWAYERNKQLSQPEPIPGVKPFLPHKVSAVYDDLRTNVPFQSMAIDGFSIPQPENIRYAHHSEIFDYLHAYVRHLEETYPGSAEHRFNSNIESVTHDGGWVITSRTSGRTVQETFDVVVVATGPFQKPSGANLHHPDFQGLSFHSMYYDDPAVLNDRTVLIIGSKNSARDMFWDAIERAKHVVIASPREQDRNNLFLVDSRFSELQERFTSVGRVKHVEKDGTIHHTNWQGQDEKLDDIAVDMIIYCTGYKREFPFLPNEFQPFSMTDNGNEVSNCFMFTAHKAHPNSLFFFHPSQARTPFNTMARDTHAQARLMASLATRNVFTSEQLHSLDETLMYWLDALYTEWAKETLNSCPCAVQNPFLMNFLNSVVDNEDDILHWADIGFGVMAFVRSRMKTRDFRKQNTIWHAGMNLRIRADAVNWNLFRFSQGRVTGGPDIDGDEAYTVTWFEENGRQHSTFHEDEIKYEELILNASFAEPQPETPALEPRKLKIKARLSIARMTETALVV